MLSKGTAIHWILYVHYFVYKFPPQVRNRDVIVINYSLSLDTGKIRKQVCVYVCVCVNIFTRYLVAINRRQLPGIITSFVRR